MLKIKSCISKCQCFRLTINQSFEIAQPLKISSIRRSHSYRNRYSHFEKGFPRYVVGFGYMALGVATVGGLMFFTLGGFVHIGCM